MSSKYLRASFGALIGSCSLVPSLALSAIGKRDGIIPAQLPGSWTSSGCYTEVGRTLSGSTYDNASANTIESCIDFCSTAGYVYAGTEYGEQCWCGNKIAPAAAPAPSGCQMTCSGNHTEACGGPDQLNIFWSGQTGPQTNPGPGLWSISGCYTEGITGRVLINGVETTGGAEAMTVALCTAACQAAGYTLAGAEYSQECWCGNTISNGGRLAPEGLSGCNDICKGNGSEFCGGTDRLDVYNFNNTFTAPTRTGTTTTLSTTVLPTSLPSAGFYVYYGCQTEGNVTRALTGKGTSSATMTIEVCEAFCAGYTYFGTEYGQECYCGGSFTEGSVAAPQSDCNFLCAGDVSEYCGAGNRLSVYKRNGTVVPTPTAITLPLPSDWTSQGCWVDGATGRILSVQQPDSTNNTIEGCINKCIALGYSIAGVEYGDQCFCDNQIENGGTLTIAQTDCYMPCSGNPAEVCGAGDRLNIYSTRSLRR